MFDIAHQGTLFLDEVGELPLRSQAKFLRVLDNPEFQRVGGRTFIRRDVRLLTATNRNLADLTETREFRLDLYHRLASGLIALPTLRQRCEDILALTEHFCQKGASRLGIPCPSVDEEVQRVLLNYAWPGNVRELRNVIENALLFQPPVLLPCHLPTWISDERGRPPTSMTERERILSALNMNRWNKERTAQALGWSRATLYRRLAKNHINYLS
jgi:DNA-binding NtrC family response regulator